MEVVKRLHAAIGRQDRDTIRELLAPNVEWIQATGFPGGRRLGAKVVLDNVLARLRRVWDGWEARVTEWLDAEPAVFALGKYQGAFKSTGQSMTAAFAGIYRVRDGRIVRFHLYTDTADRRGHRAWA